ncbi:MAG: 16S rRNA (cytosine(967)-C(5))-methyltransferase RsmB [Acidiferrobacteraceae bacterium]
MASEAARIRAAAARAVVWVGHGHTLDRALAKPPTPVGEGRSRALLQELAYGVVRWRRLLDHLYRRCLSTPGRTLDATAHALILVGLYQLRFLRVAPHAAVSETVAAADCLGRSWAKPLVNAVLRRYLRDPGMARESRAQGVRESHPDWLVEALGQDWPQQRDEILRAGNGIAPLALRVNRRHMERNAYLQQLDAAGIPAEAAAHGDAILLGSRPVHDLPGFAAGDVSVQDAGAQWVPLLLDPRPGERVLDACAAPGGKAAHIVEHTPALGALIAVDITPERVALIESTFARLGLAETVSVHQGDATTPEGWWNGEMFHRILVDAPCSGTGVIRRHPDIKWLRRPEDLGRLCALQEQLLRSLWPLLAPGGTLLYVTCSVLHAENREVVGAFLKGMADAQEVPFTLPVGHACNPGWQILPGEEQMDGFYYARLRKVD